LADRGDRRRVLIGASFFTALVGTAIAIMGHNISFALAFIFGGFSFTIYPLSMAHACEKLTEDQIVPATGGFVLSYGVGAIAGPLIAPLVMSVLGSPGLFYFMAAISFLLVIIGLKKPVAASE
jgi:MFS family permease